MPSNARAAYDRDGFYIHDRPLLDMDLVCRASAGMDALRNGEYETGVPPQPSPWNPGDPDSQFCKIELPQISNRSILEAVSHSEIGRVAAEITGADMVQVWWVQLLGKPATEPGQDAGTRVGWHQDRQYWGSWEPDAELLTAWVAISDVTEDAGPMRFVDGSHRWGLLGRGDFYAQDNDALKEQIGVPDGETWSETNAVLPPGGVSFHDCQTFHASGPNHSGEMRRSFAIHMRTNRAQPKDGKREGLTQFTEDLTRNPVIFGSLS
jgi:ectoine hydroxylase-related dioxygenase (phytanoyl-CoA dioxygenase family)